MSTGKSEENSFVREADETFRIFISRDGKWYYNGQEIIHERVLKFLSRHLQRNSKGEYYIAVEGERRPVDVEETPLLVDIVSFSQESAETFRLFLNDGSEEVLQSETLAIDEQDNVYCWVRDKKLEARFKKTSYIELAKYLQHDEVLDRYFLPQNGKRHYLKRREKDENGVQGL